MGLFGKLFGRGAGEPAAASVEEAEPEAPAVVAICRHGMNVPSEEEIADVLRLAYPTGLPPRTQRVGLSQPSWFKNQELAESAAADVARAMAQKFALASFSHHHRILERDGAARILLVEIHGEAT